MGDRQADEAKGTAAALLRPRGRPTLYTEEIGQRICERLAEGESLKSICRDEVDFPHESTVRLWARTPDHPFSTLYALARDLALDKLADEAIEIADTPVISERRTTKADGSVETVETDAVDRARLRVDTRKWYLAKLAPKRYGDRLAVGGSEEMDPIKVEVSDNELARRIAFALHKGLQQEKSNG